MKCVGVVILFIVLEGINKLLELYAHLVHQHMHAVPGFSYALLNIALYTAHSSQCWNRTTARRGFGL